MRRNLILTIGLPYSGKTTLIKSQLMKENPIISPDSLRLAFHGQRFVPEAEDMVWAMAKIMVRTLFFSGHSQVIVVATHNTAKRRDFWIDPHWRRKYLVCDVSAEVCITRAKEANDAEIIPVIERMAAEKEWDGVYYGHTGKDFEDLMIKHIENPGLDDRPVCHQGQAFD